MSTLPYGPPFLSSLQILQTIQRPIQNAINIGASDGISDDPLYPVFEVGAGGLLIEPNVEKFSRLCNNIKKPHKICEFARPDTILKIIKSFDVLPVNAISIDIDSYDHYIMQEVATLQADLLMIEINESMPPHIFFYLLYDPDYIWSNGRFFGCSLTCADFIARHHGYELIQLDWNVAYFVRSRFANLFGQKTVSQAWNEGYWNRSGRAAAYWWDNPVDLTSLKPKDQLENVNRCLSDFSGRYYASLISDISPEFTIGG